MVGRPRCLRARKSLLSAGRIWKRSPKGRDFRQRRAATRNGFPRECSVCSVPCLEMGSKEDRNMDWLLPYQEVAEVPSECCDLLRSGSLPTKGRSSQLSRESSRVLCFLWYTCADIQDCIDLQ
ncbi:uncharacterized protein LOC129681260 isoform X2 [Psammomys obesus]|uniref:uncharacterized protein LOC129681260 isoform X2 n=1 Tax=Psammomys obesus TaxID=48139 RepID=UPI0024531AC9|nr:uncharacterized protein LOC129681260 isoform X2 [Psammomys obesus]